MKMWPLERIYKHHGAKDKAQGLHPGSSNPRPFDANACGTLGELFGIAPAIPGPCRSTSTGSLGLPGILLFPHRPAFKTSAVPKAIWKPSIPCSLLCLPAAKRSRHVFSIRRLQVERAWLRLWSRTCVLQGHSQMSSTYSIRRYIKGASLFPSYEPDNCLQQNYNAGFVALS